MECRNCGRRIYALDKAEKAAGRAKELRRRAGDLAYDAEDRKVSEALERLHDHLDVFVEWLEGDLDDRELKRSLGIRKAEDLMSRALQKIDNWAGQTEQYARGSIAEEEIGFLQDDVHQLQLNVHTDRL